VVGRFQSFIAGVKDEGLTVKQGKITLETTRDFINGQRVARTLPEKELLAHAQTANQIMRRSALPVAYESSMTPQRKIALGAAGVLATATAVTLGTPKVQEYMNRPSTLQTTFTGLTTEKAEKEQALQASRKDPTPGTTKQANQGLQTHLETQTQQLKQLETPILNTVKKQKENRQKAALFAAVKQDAERSGKDLTRWQQDASELDMQVQKWRNKGTYEQAISSLSPELQQKLNKNPILAGTFRDSLEDVQAEKLTLTPSEETLQQTSEKAPVALRLKYNVQEVRQGDNQRIRGIAENMTAYYNPETSKYRVVDDAYARQLYALGLTEPQVLEEATVLLEEAKHPKP
jgi:hypothetical protein